MQNTTKKVMYNTLKKTGKATIWAAEKLYSELALPGAVLSTTGNEGYLGNVVQGLTAPMEGIYEFGKAYANNEGIRDSTNGLVSKVLIGMGNMAENIVESPLETVLAAGTTFALYKAIPVASKKLRQYISKK